jgi:hypothetical protein
MIISFKLYQYVIVLYRGGGILLKENERAARKRPEKSYNTCPSRRLRSKFPIALKREKIGMMTGWMQVREPVSLSLPIRLMKR